MSLWSLHSLFPLLTFPTSRTIHFRFHIPVTGATIARYLVLFTLAVSDSSVVDWFMISVTPHKMVPQAVWKFKPRTFVLSSNSDNHQDTYVTINVHYIKQNSNCPLKDITFKTHSTFSPAPLQTLCVWCHSTSLQRESWVFKKNKTIWDQQMFYLMQSYCIWIKLSWTCAPVFVYTFCRRVHIFHRA